MAAQAEDRLIVILNHIEAVDGEHPNYGKRYHLVLQALAEAAACGLAAGMRLDPDEPAWPVVYIELPEGQISWHMPQHETPWDGHDTAEKYRRVHAFQQRVFDQGLRAATHDESATTPRPPLRTSMTRPTVVCLCGSTRFWRDFQRAGLAETMAGRIVLSIGAASGTDDEHFGNLPRDEYDRVKAMLDELHLRKIDLADEILVLNVGGYVGESTRRELAYAQAQGKRVRWLEEPGEPAGAPLPAGGKLWSHRPAAEEG